jgi:iron complex transport system substrate-binding protein
MVQDSETPPRPLRVASLLPAATETVCALGQRRALVGVSHECDFPPEVVGLPVLTSSRLRAPESSAAIDRGVRELVRDSLAIYEVDVEALRRADPDLVLTQDLCEVCAVPLEAVEQAVRALGRPDVRIVSLRPTRLDDIWEDIRRVAEALGARERGQVLLDALAQRVAAVAERAARLPVRPKVLTIEWLDPVMVGGTWMPELVELAHGEPLAARAGEPAPTLSDDELAALQPDVVVFKPCGFTLERSEMEIARIEDLVARMPWPAALAGDVFLADGNAYFNRPGPRIADSLEILAACIHGFEFADLSKKHVHAFTRLAQHGRRGRR